MPQPKLSQQPRKSNWGSLLLVLLPVVAIAVAALVLARPLFDPQWNLTIAEVVDSGAETVVTDPEDVTDAVCAQAKCVEAYDTQEALYLRFGSRAEAAHYVAAAPDAFQSNYIVMDFTGKSDVAPERQRWAMENLVGTWQDFTGTLPQR